MHDGMLYDPIQGQGQGQSQDCLKATQEESTVSPSRDQFLAVARPSVCRLSVTLVRPTQAVEIFGNISTALGNLAIL